MNKFRNCFRLPNLLLFMFRSLYGPIKYIVWFDSGSKKSTVLTALIIQPAVTSHCCIHLKQISNIWFESLFGWFCKNAIFDCENLSLNMSWADYKRGGRKCFLLIFQNFKIWFPLFFNFSKFQNMISAFKISSKLIFQPNIFLRWFLQQHRNSWSWAMSVQVN